jgi:hypothetical protein
MAENFLFDATQRASSMHRQKLPPSFACIAALRRDRRLIPHAPNEDKYLFLL